MKASPDAQKRALRELALLYLRLGATAFGGPAAHIAMMEEEVVRRRRWLTREKFLELMGAANLIPGPSSTELSIYIGHLRAGWPGLIVAGVCFITPAALLTLGFAFLYVRFGALPQVGAVLHGVKPVIIAIVVQALSSLAPAALKNGWLALVGVGAAAASVFAANPLLVLLASGATTAAASAWRRRNSSLCIADERHHLGWIDGRGWNCTLQPDWAVPGIPQDRGRAVWKRVRPACLPPRRFCG
jgi:chromate transporter